MIEPNELWILLVTFSVIIVFFSVLSLLFLQGKAFFLISGYNMLSAAKQAEYDPKKLGRFMAVFMWITNGFLIALLFVILLNQETYVILLVILMIVTMVGLLIYGNTGNRLKRTREDGIESSRYDV